MLQLVLIQTIEADRRRAIDENARRRQQLQSAARWDGDGQAPDQSATRRLFRSGRTVGLLGDSR